MTRLRRLNVYNRTPTPIRFQAGLELVSLDLYGRLDVTESLMREIANLEKLEWLTLKNRGSVTVDIVKPLGKLKHLETVRIERMTPEAKAFIASIVVPDEG